MILIAYTNPSVLKFAKDHIGNIRCKSFEIKKTLPVSIIKKLETYFASDFSFSLSAYSCMLFCMTKCATSVGHSASCRGLS